MASLSKIREDYEPSPWMTEAEAVAWEIDAAWEEHRGPQEEEKDYEEDLMWREYEFYSKGVWEREFYRKAYRGEPLPVEVQRWLRNDGVADWYEICVLKD